MWSYKDILQGDYEKAANFVESIIEKLGAVCVGESEEAAPRKIWKFRNEYVRVDRICFPEKPFIVLEFSDQIEGFYEDADPFPYDLPENELVLEAKYALGILPYPEWNEQFREKGLIGERDTLLARSNRFIVYNCYEDAYLKNVDTKEIIELGDFYGDPEIAMIDTDESFCIVAGGDKICIYQIEAKQYKVMECRPEWIASMNQEDSEITIIFEDGTRKKLDVYK